MPGGLLSFSGTAAGATIPSLSITLSILMRYSTVIVLMASGSAHKINTGNCQIAICCKFCPLCHLVSVNNDCSLVDAILISYQSLHCQMTNEDHIYAILMSYRHCIDLKLITTLSYGPPRPYIFHIDVK